MSSIGNACVRAVKWSAISTAGRFALQLVAQVVLARILGPENYGLFGIGMAVYTFGNFVSSFGFGRSLLQKLEISDEDIRFAFTWQLITGGAATLAIFLASPWLADYFNEPRVLLVIQWLSLACLLNAATSPASNLLQRDLNFKMVGLIQVGSYAIGYLVLGIPLALAGYEVFALVTAWLTQISITLVATYSARPHPLRPLLWFSGARSAVSYGGTVFVTNIVNWLLNNLDRVVIGRLLNTQAVGLYAAGYNLATLPNTLLLGTLQTTFLASGAKLQTDRERLGENYLQVLATIWVLLLPAFVFLAVISPQIIALLYGEGWEESAVVLSVLFLAMPAFITGGLSTPVLWNSGREKYELLLQTPVLIAGAWAFFAYAGHGLATVASIAAGIFFLRASVLAFAAIKAVGMPMAPLLPEMARGVALSVLSAGTGILGQHISMQYGLPLLTLCLCSSLAVLVFSIICWLRPSMLGHRTQNMLYRFVPRLKRHNSI